MKINMKTTLAFLLIVGFGQVQKAHAYWLRFFIDTQRLQLKNFRDMSFHSIKELSLQDKKTVDDIYRVVTLSTARAARGKNNMYCTPDEIEKELDFIITNDASDLSENAKKELSEWRGLWVSYALDCNMGLCDNKDVSASLNCKIQKKQFIEVELKSAIQAHVIRNTDEITEDSLTEQQKEIRDSCRSMP